MRCSSDAWSPCKPAGACVRVPVSVSSDGPKYSLTMMGKMAQRPPYDRPMPMTPKMTSSLRVKSQALARCVRDMNAHTPTSHQPFRTGTTSDRPMSRRPDALDRLSSRMSMVVRLPSCTPPLSDCTMWPVLLICTEPEPATRMNTIIMIQ